MGGSTFGTIDVLARQGGFDGPPPGPSPAEIPAFLEHGKKHISQLGSDTIPRSEIDMARHFAESYHSELRHVADWGWLRYDGRRWQRDQVFAAWRRAQQIASYYAGMEQKEKDRRRVASKSTVHAIVDLARSQSSIVATPDQWDANPVLLNTPGGVVDLSTGMLRDHRPDDLLTKITSVAPVGECPVWLEFLDRVTGNDIELQVFLQRVAGYCLTGSVKEHALFFLYGPEAMAKVSS